MSLRSTLLMRGNMSSASAVAVPTSTKQPILLDQLRSDGFKLTPNYDRALDGRIVDTRLDPETGLVRDVTDFESAGGITFSIPAHLWKERAAYGRRIKQVWHFTAEDMQLRYNEAWNGATHFGLQYASLCTICNSEHWNNADRPPKRLCAKCRTLRCPVTGRATSTAYQKHDCRCETCRTWNAGRMRRWRRCNHFVSKENSKERTEGEINASSSSLSSTNKVVTRSSDWTWLPLELLSSIARHERTQASRPIPRQSGYRDPNKRELDSGSQEYWDRTQDQLNIVTA